MCRHMPGLCTTDAACIMRRGTLAKSSKRRHIINVGVCNVHFYHLLPYSTLVWVGKSAFIAFIIICVQAPADGKGGAPVVRISLLERGSCPKLSSLEPYPGSPDTTRQS